MGRPKRSSGVETAEAIDAEKTKREKAQKSYKEESDSNAEVVSEEEEESPFVEKKKDADVDFSDEDVSASESESEYDGESSGSEYGKKKKSPVKKIVGRGRGRKAAAASPAAKGKGRGRGRPPAASKNGKKAPAKRGRKDDSDESESGDSSGSDFGKKKAPPPSPKKKVAPAKAAPKRKAVAKSSSPAPESRARRGRPAASKTYKEVSEDDIEEVSEDDKPLTKRAKLEPKAKKETPPAKKKEETGSEDEDQSMEDEEEEEKKEETETKKNGSAKKETIKDKEEVKDEEDMEEDDDDVDDEKTKEKDHAENNKNGNGNGAESDDASDVKEPATPISEDGSLDADDEKITDVKNKTDYSKIVFETDKKTAKGDAWNFKIACWNIGGIKAWIKKNGIEYLGKEDADILCFNEVRCNDKTKPAEFTKLDKYPHLYWSFNAEHSGHSGVSIFSKVEAKSVQYGFPEADADSTEDKKSKQGFSKEGRLITCEFENFYLINAYVPNSGRPAKSEKYPKGYPPKVANGERQKFNTFFLEYVKDLEKKKPVIVTGDLNVAHEEIDLANPKSNDKSAGFTKEEREDFTQLLEDTTLFDSFRALYPDEKAYTFWSYMHNSRQKNIGWRLDYFLLSEKLRDSLCDNVNRSDVFGSDHCPIVLFMKN